MSKTVINKREQLKWNNGFDPNGKSIPDITESDEGKFIKVVDGVLAFGEGGGSGSTYTAGDNIQISADNVISATDTTYTAGTNISISAQNEISATDTTYSAGTGISIDSSNVISADSQLPSVSSSDEGKVLKVDSNGDWAVGTDDNTTYSAGTNITIDANNQISATDTTYSAGEGIDITSQVVSSPDAVMAKEGIADDYVGTDGTLPFYPIFSDAITGTGNMERDCLAGQNTGWAGTAGARPYSTTRNDVYMAIYKDSGNYGIVLFTTGNAVSGDGSVKIQYINSDGTLQSDEASPYLISTFTGTVNSGYTTGSSGNYCLYHSQYSKSNADLITCAKDLSLCVYNSYQDAEDAFGAWQIPGIYSEGDQVWKDGKLQTYTSGSWTDSDTIVEQLAGKVDSSDIVTFYIDYDSGTSKWLLQNGKTSDDVKNAILADKSVQIVYDNNDPVSRVIRNYRFKEYSQQNVISFECSNARNNDTAYIESINISSTTTTDEVTIYKKLLRTKETTRIGGVSGAWSNQEGTDVVVTKSLTDWKKYDEILIEFRPKTNTAAETSTLAGGNALWDNTASGVSNVIARTRYLKGYKTVDTDDLPDEATFAFDPWIIQQATTANSADISGTYSATVWAGLKLNGTDYDLVLYHKVASSSQRIGPVRITVYGIRYKYDN